MKIKIEEISQKVDYKVKEMENNTENIRKLNDSQEILHCNNKHFGKRKWGRVRGRLEKSTKELLKKISQN